MLHFIFYIIENLLKPGYPQPKDVVLIPVFATGINIHVHRSDLIKWTGNRNGIKMKGNNYTYKIQIAFKLQFW